jgi:hypothetical protein
MLMYDQDYRRLMCEERAEQLARSAGSSRRRRHRAKRQSLRMLLRPAAYRRPQLEG